MKTLFYIVILSGLFLGCTYNPPPIIDPGNWVVKEVLTDRFSREVIVEDENGDRLLLKWGGFRPVRGDVYKIAKSSGIWRLHERVQQ